MNSSRPVKFLLLFSLSIISSFGQKAPSAPDPIKRPWLGALFNINGQTFICGSTLITQQHVLTAAHCVQPKNVTTIMSSDDVMVYFGKYNFSVAHERGAVVAYADSITIHPDWKPFAKDYDADLAVIKLDADVTFRPNIAPVGLWTKPLKTGSTVGKIVGWGHTRQQKNGKHSEVSRELALKIVYHYDCIDYTGLNVMVSARTFCAGGGGNGPCRGDDGSGFLVTENSRTFISGIFSAALLTDDNKCNVNAPSLFTNVQKYEDWIKSATRQKKNFDRPFSQSNCEMLSTRSRRSLGGYTFEPNDWPMLASLFNKTNMSYFCAGTLISKRHILTAAHCIQNKKAPKPLKPAEAIVFLGRHNLSNPQEAHSVSTIPKKFFLHPDWDTESGNWDADIAIIELASDVRLTEKIYPACLWTSDMTVSMSNEGTLIGWGAKENSKYGDHSDVPRELTLPVRENEVCYRINGLSQMTTNRGICAGGNGAGPCFGDSGGGYFTEKDSKWFVRGIVSASLVKPDFTCDIDNPAILTDVKQFTSWIKEKLGRFF